MQQIVEREMKQGRLGIGTALEYAPAYYADTEELVELCKVAAKYKGKYISHMRSEGERLLEGIDEVIRSVAKQRSRPRSITSAAGQEQLEEDGRGDRQGRGRPQGRASTHGRHVLLQGRRYGSRLHPAVGREGGDVAMRRRFRDADDRKRSSRTFQRAMAGFYLNAGSPDNVLLIGFKKESLKSLQGKTLGANCQGS